MNSFARSTFHFFRSTSMICVTQYHYVFSVFVLVYQYLEVKTKKQKKSIKEKKPSRTHGHEINLFEQNVIPLRYYKEFSNDIVLSGLSTEIVYINDNHLHVSVGNVLKNDIEQ